MDKFITELLATVFDGFKAKNPKIAAIILLLLGVLLFAINNGLSDIIGSDLTNYANWIVFILAALQGTRTTSFLPEHLKKSRE